MLMTITYFMHFIILYEKYIISAILIFFITKYASNLTSQRVKAKILEKKVQKKLAQRKELIESSKKKYLENFKLSDSDKKIIVNSSAS